MDTVLRVFKKSILYEVVSKMLQILIKYTTFDSNEPFTGHTQLKNNGKNIYLQFVHLLAIVTTNNCIDICHLHWDKRLSSWNTDFVLCWFDLLSMSFENILHQKNMLANKSFMKMTLHVTNVFTTACILKFCLWKWYFVISSDN